MSARFDDFLAFIFTWWYKLFHDGLSYPSATRRCEGRGIAGWEQYE